MPQRHQLFITYYVHIQVLGYCFLVPLRLTRAQMLFTFPTPREIAVDFACWAAVTPYSDNSTSFFVWGAAPPLLSGPMGLGDLASFLHPVVKL